MQDVKPQFYILDCMLHYSVILSMTKAFKNAISSVQNDATVHTNARLKFYPTSDGKLIPWDCTIFACDIYKRDGFDIIDDTPPKKNASHRLRDEQHSSENKRKSFARARNNLFDLLQCNSDIGWFVTLTLDGEKIDRYDYQAVVRKLGQWLDNSVRRKTAKYILVPEFHKDGAVHFHGFINCDVFSCAEARNPHTGKLIKHHSKQVYNISDYKLGYSTAIPIAPNEYNATCKYVYKYITKAGGEKVGGRYYFSGGDLRRPHFEYFDADFLGIDCDTHTLSCGYEYKKIKFEGDTNSMVDFLRSVNR